MNAPVGIVYSHPDILPANPEAFAALQSFFPQNPIPAPDTAAPLTHVRDAAQEEEDEPEWMEGEMWADSLFKTFHRRAAWAVEAQEYAAQAARLLDVQVPGRAVALHPPPKASWRIKRATALITAAVKSGKLQDNALEQAVRAQAYELLYGAYWRIERFHPKPVAP